MNALSEPITSKHTDQGVMAVDAEVDGEEKSRKSRETSEELTIRYASSSMQGWRVTMEDAHLLVPSPKISMPQEDIGHITLKNHALFAVFDGHGGDFTSLYACEHMLRVLTARKEMVEYARMENDERGDVPGVELLKSAMEGAFIDLDEELRQRFRQNIADVLSAELERRQAHNEGRTPDNTAIRQLEPIPILSYSPEESGVEVPLMLETSTNTVKLDRSGSTAVAVLLTPTHIICANAGDSRAILVKSGRALPLSFDHKPTNHVERSRILRAGGEVRTRRVDGDLAVSRGLGDFRFKDEAKLKADKQKVSAKPDLIVNPRDSAADEFIVLACDGIWDVMQNSDCAKAVQEILDEGETNVGLVCEEILDKCLYLESRDNMTACVVALPACKIMSEAEIKNKGKCGVKELRERRKESGLTPGQARKAKAVAQSAVGTLDSSLANSGASNRNGADANALSLQSFVTEHNAQAPLATE
eukprot:CAMPEP_0113561652 /NCGR_PEP_ID=MMETSP0015_2-20120614/20091_1 /TAXON_ID=2838 /ORGANISM="Odontella" /LENGTH=474 /DNA_ID=CAMNT_0000463463 /DNA_START=216 /DNA_END=1640 /DNA_ORIENTATION=+ /assembly_acc=CAM_ASM_000160